MNVAQSALGLAVAGGLLSALLAGLVPARGRAGVSGAGAALVGGAGVLSGTAAVCGQSFALTLPALLPTFGTAVAMDRLGGVFVAVTGGVAVAAGIYRTGYAATGGEPRLVSALLPLFVTSMLLVPVAAGVGTLLACWELMALTSLLLVLTEHRHRVEVGSAGRWYAVMTHLGFLALAPALMIFAGRAHGDTFTQLRMAAGHLPSALSGVVFVLVLAGFGGKAGLVPLHAWLPRAHPEAPSYVSALMSAAMVNLGVYGVVRVGFDLLGGGSRWWWVLVLLCGAASAVYGVLQAAMSTDLKRLLAYSTTENMGLAFVGVGAAGLFACSGDRVLAGLSLSAALLHVVNHAGFKTLLFLAAGSVVRTTGTRDLDELGGLRAAMPLTTLAFGWGALAASALPPGNGFVSEWLLVQALIHGLPASGAVSAVVLPVAVAAVALAAGLAVATFVKAFGVGFLARPRGAAAAGARESPVGMLVGMALAGAVCVLLAVLPGVVLPGIGALAGAVVGSAAPAVSGLLGIQLIGVTGTLSPLLLALSLAAAATAALVAVRTGAARRATRLWDCGAGPMSARMEYTATSFAEPLQRVFDNVVAPETDIDVTHYEESRYLVASVAYRQRVPDRIEQRLYRPVLAAIDRWGRAGRRLATGSVHRYLGYGFYTLTAVLIVLAMYR